MNRVVRLSAGPGTRYRRHVWRGHLARGHLWHGHLWHGHLSCGHLLLSPALCLVPFGA
jgi:hypothetical protein